LAGSNKADQRAIVTACLAGAVYVPVAVASVAMLEKLALLTMASCSAPAFLPQPETALARRITVTGFCVSAVRRRERAAASPSGTG